MYQGVTCVMLVVIILNQGRDIKVLNRSCQFSGFLCQLVLGLGLGFG